MKCPQCGSEKVGYIGTYSQAGDWTNKLKWYHCNKCTHLFSEKRAKS